MRIFSKKTVVLIIFAYAFFGLGLTGDGNKIIWRMREVHAQDLSEPYQDKLNNYAAETVRYFTNSYSNNLETGFPHAFAGHGKFQVPAGDGSMRQESWNLSRGYGSHVNINEVTLRFLSLAVAYKMGWESNYDLTWGQIREGLQTLKTMQHSKDSIQFHNGHFHRTYLTTNLTTNAGDVDRDAVEITRDYNENMQSSDDNGLPYMNLTLLEGLANDQTVNIADREIIIALCREVCDAIDLRDFVKNNQVIFNYEDGNPSLGIWDRESAEGPIILAAMLLSGQITLNEFYNIAPSLENHPVNWSSFSHGNISINKPSFHSAMFIHGLRTIHGMPVTADESPGLNYFETSTEPILKAGLDYSGHYSYKALGSQVMTQALNGVPVFEMGGTQVEFPGNEGNHIPVPGASLSPVTGPHAWFVPLARWRNLDSADVKTIFAWMNDFESEFFHTDIDKYGWEAAIPWQPGDRTYAWQASDGTWKYTDWGRPYEALNTAYILLSIFDALNPDAPLASYSVEVDRMKHIAAYFDSGVLLPAGLFPDPSIPSDDHGNSMSNASPLSLNNTIAGNIESAGDYDYFRISVPAPGGDITIYTTGDTDTFGYLEDSGDFAFVSNDDGGIGENFRIARYLSNRSYYIAVKHKSLDGTGSYTLHADFTPRALDNDPSGEGTTTVIIEAESNETDYSRIYGRENANNKWVLHLDSGESSVWNTPFNAPMNGVVECVVRYSNSHWVGTLETVNVYIKEEGADDSTKQLMDKSFTAQDTGDGGGGWEFFADSPVLSTNLNPGFYQIQYYISSGDAHGVDLDCATLTIPTPGDDHGNSIGQATTIDPKCSVNGSIESAGDNDYFKVQPASSGSLTIFTTGHTDTCGYLLNSGGGTITSNNTGMGRNFKIFRMVSGSIYYVRVKHASPTGAGSYLLHLNFSTDDHGDDIAGATLVGTNTSISGSIEMAGDHDYFEVQISASGNLLVETTGGTNTTGSLLDDTGTTISSDDNSGTGSNFRIVESVSAGTYYVDVEHSTSSTGAYVLHVDFDYVDDLPPEINPVIPNPSAAAEDTPIVIDLTAYETDIEDTGAALHWTVTSYNSAMIASISGQNSDNDVLTFTPQPNVFGSTDVTLRLTDSGGLYDEQQITLTWNPVPDLPIISPAIPNPPAVDEDTAIVIDLTAYETDVENTGTALDWTVTNYNSAVIASIAGQNSDNDVLTFTPQPNVYGSTDITLRLTDSGGLYDEQTITLTWNPVPDPPVISPAIPNPPAVAKDTPIVIDLTAYETDAEDSGIALDWTVTSYNSAVIASIAGENSDNDVLTFTPQLNVYGSTVVTLRLTDSGGLYDEQTITLTWNPVPDFPIISPAIPDPPAVDEDVIIVMDLTGYETDAEDTGTALDWTVTSYNSAMIASISGQNSDNDVLTFTPQPNVYVSTNVTLRLTDSGGLYDEQTITLTWNPVPDPPVISPAIPDPPAVNEDNPIIVDLTSYETDVEDTGTSLDWTISSYDVAMIDSIAGENADDNILTFTPKPDVFGSTAVTLRLTDSGGLYDEQTITLTWNEVSEIPDEELLDGTEAKAALYFYNETFPNGFVKDGAHQSFSSISATGFGLASLCVMAERYESTANWTVSSEEARARANQILDTYISLQELQVPAGNEYGVAGFLYHFVNSSGTRQGASEVSTIEMALFLAGAITAGEYFGAEVQTKAEQIYDTLDWSYFLNAGEEKFWRSWSPENRLFDQIWDSPGDREILVSLLAIGSDPDNEDFLKTMYSWPRATDNYAGYDVVNSYYGSMSTYLFAHCFADFEWLGSDDPSFAGSPAASVNWWDNSVNAVYANRQFCIDESASYSSYGPDSWGITPCEYPGGGYAGSLGAKPCESNDGNAYHNGTIAPYGAISSMPFMRTSSDEILDDNLAFKALKHYYTSYYDDLWGDYGPYDSFNHNSQFSSHYLGIDVGLEVLMIENYRSRLIWNQFMKNSRILAAAEKVFGKVPIVYVDIANAGDPDEDGSSEHPFDTIQEGIDAAVSGDTVQVAAGTYNENVILNKSGIILQGDSSIITGNPGIYCENINGDETIITGFAMRTGYYGIKCAGTVSSLRIENNSMSKPSTVSGYGIYLEEGASAIIKDNSIYKYGKGIYGKGNNTVDIINNAISWCRGSYGGGIYLIDTTALIKDNYFASCWDGAISLYSSSNVTIVGNTLSYNGSWDKSAGLHIANSTVMLRNNLITGNRVSHSQTVGGGLYAIGSNISAFNNIFRRNTSGSGAAIKVSDTNFTAKNNIFVENQGATETVYFGGTGTQEFSYNAFWANTTERDTIGIEPWPGENIIADPLFMDYVDYYLDLDSPCINTGDPNSQFNDLNFSRNDMGIHGGPYGSLVNSVIIEPGESIQTAINSATSGMTISAPTGTYTEDIIMKPGVDLVGESAENTIIEGNILCLEADDTIENLTIIYDEGEYATFTNSYYTDLQVLADAGITAVDSEITVRNCIIYPNSYTPLEPLGGMGALGAAGPFGKGIQIWNLYGLDAKAPMIDNILIVHCDTGIYYYSQAFSGDVAGTIQNSTLDANKYGIVLRMHNENPLIQNNIISNSLDGIHITYEDEALLTDRLDNITNNCIFIQDPSGYPVYCDALGSEVTPTGAGNIYEDPLYENPPYLDYYPENLDCADMGYRE